MMLDDEIDVNIVFKPGFTPISVAASQGHEKFVQLLLARGAHQRVRNYEDEEPLRKATRARWVKVRRNTT